MSPPHSVIERFPDHWAAITALLRADADFRSLCEDYGQAVEALRRWQASPGHETSVDVREFLNLVAELEQEILSALGTESDEG